MEKALIVFLFMLPIVAADCNIDSAGIKTHSTSDGLVVSKVGVVATFRLGCSQGFKEPRLHAETTDGKYVAVSASNLKPEFKSVSFVEETSQSKSRWIEIKVFDDETYTKLLAARRSGSSESYYKPMKTISISHYGVAGGPFMKMETLATLGLIASFFFAHRIRSKIVD